MRTAQLDAAIVVENLAKSYRVTKKSDAGVLAAMKSLFHREYKMINAVRSISFSIDPGEMVGFLGPNGAGKTTTLKMLSGLIFPTSGSARVLGFVPWERSNDYRRQFALVMGQKNQLWWDLPARESFRLHREIYGIPADRFRQVHDELVDLLNLGELIGQPVRELSLGERMKMELVAALLHSPKVLFLDEPTIGLDVVAQAQLRDFLKQYNSTNGVTVLLTSHYMKDVESLCQRIIVINHGRIIHDGPLDDIVMAFSNHKILELDFAGVQAPTGLDRYGEVIETKGPKARLRVDRQAVPKVLADVLDHHQVLDLTVDDVPLEEVIAQVFRSSAQVENGARD